MVVNGSGNVPRWPKIWFSPKTYTTHDDKRWHLAKTAVIRRTSKTLNGRWRILFWISKLVLLRFSKSCKRSVSAGFVKKIRGFGFWWRHYKLMCTEAIERTSPVQTQRNYRPTCRAFNNNAEAIIISDSYLKGLDISASRPRQDAVAPFNTALFDLHLDHSTTTSSLSWHQTLSAASSLTHATQHIYNANNATYTTSVQWHGWNLSHDMACVKF